MGKRIDVGAKARYLPALGLWAAVCGGLLQMGPAHASQRETNVETVVVAAGAKYATSHAGQDWLLGAGYRDLWAAPIEVPLLDLEETAGGLSPVMRVGGLQTLGLALRGEDGRAYTFRSVDKEGLLALPEGFKDSGLEVIIRDQVSSALPGADLIAGSLAATIGVLHADAKLVVMPDDPRLGEFREAFAGALGTFYEFPTAGSFGSTDVYGDDDFLARLWSGEDRADSRAFLRARLLDLLIGDWDRHHGQWRWARIPGRPRLQPIPEDRDQAFSRYDGLAMSVARIGGAQMTNFESDYPPLRQLAFNGSDFDRVVLTDLERDVWMDVAKDVQQQLDDDAIHAAVSELPEAYYRLRGEELEQKLRARRDGLVDYAARFYAFLNEHVDVHGTDRDEVTVLERLEDGGLGVQVTLVDSDTPYYRRRFVPSETDDVRLYLRAGNNRVVVEGADGRPIRVRVIGGPGHTTVEGPRRRGVKLYQDPDGDGYITALNAEDAKRAFSPVLEANWEIQVPGSPYRDWGMVLQPIVVGRWHPDLGLAIGGGVDFKEFGFGKLPWGSRHRVSGAYAIGSNNALARYEGDFRRVGGGVHFETDLFASGMEQLRYYGLGNETSRGQPDHVFEIGQRVYGAGAYLALGELRNPLFRVGPIVRFVDSRRTSEESLLGREAPYGFDEFAQLGIQADFVYDSRLDKPTLSSGFDVDARARYHPSLWDVERDYGFLEGAAGGHFQIARPLTVSVLFGGRKVWGPFPYFDAAYLGGEDVFDAYSWNRFAGDAMARGGVRLRWALAHLKLTVPGDLGLSLRADVGRTFLGGELSSRWHPQFMAGLFYAAFDRLLLLEVGVGWSAERTLLTFEADFDWLIR